MSEPTPVVDAEIIDESTGEVLPARQTVGIVRAAGDVAESFAEYREVQAALDASLTDCTMQIAGNTFRKKNYWRAVATAFNLNVEKHDESEQRSPEDAADWGYLVTYRATAPNGRTADGDGTCFASEKWTNRQTCPQCNESEFAYRSKNQGGPEFFCWKKKGGCGNEWDAPADSATAIDKSQSTVHNIRSHAHTRAFNRAVSNLVGFGEVSAEEMDQDRPARRRQAHEPPEEPPERWKDTAPAPELDHDAEFLFTLESKPPPSPRYTKWRQSTASKGSSMKDRLWADMEQGPWGGGRYSWLRKVLTYENATDATKSYALCCVWAIEREELQRRKDEGGEVTKF